MQSLLGRIVSLLRSKPETLGLFMNGPSLARTLRTNYDVTQCLPNGDVNVRQNSSLSFQMPALEAFAREELQRFKVDLLTALAPLLQIEDEAKFDPAQLTEVANKLLEERHRQLREYLYPRFELVSHTDIDTLCTAHFYNHGR